jgi:hypothetical protein
MLAHLAVLTIVHLNSTFILSIYTKGYKYKGDYKAFQQELEV